MPLFSKTKCSPSRRVAGAKSKRSGALFESLIDASCRYYADRSVALIEKTPEPFRVTGRLGGGRFEGHYLGTAQPDYKGVYKGGRCVVFEAKHTDGDRITQNRVTPEQIQCLDIYSQMGAVCFIAVSLYMIDFYKIPLEVWRNMKQTFGRKYMTREDLEKYRVPMVSGVIRLLDLEERT